MDVATVADSAVIREVMDVVAARFTPVSTETEAILVA